MTLREMLFAECFAAHLATRKLPVLAYTALNEPLYATQWIGEFTRKEDGTFDADGALEQATTLAEKMERAATARAPTMPPAASEVDRHELAAQLRLYAFEAQRVGRILSHVAPAPNGHVERAREVSHQLHIDLEALAAKTGAR